VTKQLKSKECQPQLQCCLLVLEQYSFISHWQCRVPKRERAYILNETLWHAEEERSRKGEDTCVRSMMRVGKGGWGEEGERALLGPL